MSDKYNKEEESVLQKIQNQTGCLLLVIGIAMLAFVLTDLLSSGTSIFGSTSNSVGEIAGEEVSYEEYQVLYEQLIQRAQANNPNLEMNEAFTESYKQEAWNSIVQEKLVEKEYNALGLGVSGAEMEDMTLGSNTHPAVVQAFKNPQTGEFDKAMLSKFLREDIETNPDAKKSWVTFERDLSKQLITEKYTALLSLSYYVTELEARISIHEEQANRGVNLVGLNYASIPDSTITVSDSDIESYLEDNRGEYEQTANRDIEFVVFNVVPSQEDTIKTQNWIDDNKEKFQSSKDDSAFVSYMNSETPFDVSYLPRGSLSIDVESDIFSADSGTVLGPYENSGVYSMFKVTDIGKDSITSVKVSHVLFRANSGDTIQAMKDARAGLADIRSGKSVFEDLAVENNVDQSRNDGGNLGWLREESFSAPKRFINEAKKHSLGSYFIVTTSNGVQLGKVTGASTTKTVQIAQLSQSVQASTETDRAYYRQAGEFLTSLGGDKSFEESAESMGYTKRVANKINEKERRVAGIKNGNMIARWLFDDATKEGGNSDIIEVDGNYVVALVTKIRKDGLPDIEDVRSNVEPLVRDLKKADILKPQVEEALANSASAKELAKALNTIVTPVHDLNYRDGNIPYVGQDEALVGAAFGTPISQRTQVLVGKNGVFVIYVEQENEIQYPEDLMAKQVELRERITQTLAPAVEQALVDLGNVKDLRYKYY